VNRLHIHKITSIGAVEDGDNDEASKILFYKSGTPKPSGVSFATLEAKSAIRDRRFTDLERCVEALNRLVGDSGPISALRHPGWRRGDTAGPGG
jgi:hypothetical protein